MPTKQGLPLRTPGRTSISSDRSGYRSRSDRALTGSLRPAGSNPIACTRRRSYDSWISIDCHAFGLRRSFTLADLLDDTALVVAELLGSVDRPEVTVLLDRGWAIEKGRTAMPNRSPALDEWSIDEPPQRLGVYVEDRRVGGLLFGAADERRICSVSPARTAVGWTVSVAVCLAAARLGDGTFSDERWSPPTVGLDDPAAIIAAAALRQIASSFDAACQRWEAQFDDRGLAG